MVWVSVKHDDEFEGKLLQKFKDVFTSYDDMQGVKHKFYQHNIILKDDAVPIMQERCWMNTNYVAKVKEEIDNELLRVGFIYLVGKLGFLQLW